MEDRGYNFVKNVDLFFEKYTPLPRGYGGIFSEQQSVRNES